MQIILRSSSLKIHYWLSEKWNRKINAIMQLHRFKGFHSYGWLVEARLRFLCCLGRGEVKCWKLLSKCWVFWRGSPFLPDEFLREVCWLLWQAGKLSSSCAMLACKLCTTVLLATHSTATLLYTQQLKPILHSLTQRFNAFYQNILFFILFVNNVFTDDLS